MKKFLAIYKGHPESDPHIEWNKLPPEEQQKRMQQGMASWGKWMQDHNSKIDYAGGPLGKTLIVNKDGVAQVKNKDCGYVIVEAESHEEAAKMFLNHPHFSIFPGENIEIMECLPTPGSKN